MNKIKVSIIIPVYNTEKYIEEAIRSILNQTLTDIEILVINDGSIDKSLEIIYSLAETDNRIRVFSQDNKGQSVARNMGLDNVRGEYIYFMDSDDILEKKALEVCYNKCNGKQLDFVFFDALNFSDENLSLPLDYDRSGKIDDKLIYQGPDILNILLDIKEYKVPLWLYFIKSSFIKKNDLSFSTGLMHEDQIFTAQIFLLAQRVGYIPEIFFKRRVRLNSIMTRPFSVRSMNDYFEIAKTLLSFVKDKPLSIQSLNSKTIKFIFDPAVYASSSLNLRERIYIARICVSEFRKYISLKSWLVLLFPWLITLKSYFK